MSKTIVLICLICVVLTGLSMPVVERDDFNLSMDFFGITSVNYNLLADATDYDVLMAFDISKCQFGINGMYKNIEYVFNTSYQIDQLRVNDLFIKYHFSDKFNVKIGYFNAPFGRVGYVDDRELLMYSRNPLYGNYSPGRKIGIAPEFEMLDGMLSVSAGAYNGDDFENINEDKYFDYSGVVHFMPLGKFDYSESAREGFVDMKIDISPGFCIEKEDVYYDYPEETLETMTCYGTNLSWRYNTIAFDMAYYIKNYSLDLDGFDNHQIEGYSLQLAYAINGRFEPSIRYTSDVELYDFDYEGNEGFYYSYEQRTSEYGFTWYLNDNSKLGLVYIYKDYVEEFEDSWVMEIAQEKNEVRLFYALDL